MAVRGSKKGQDNFEKLKREMTEKKQKATQQNPETLQKDIENIDLIKNLDIEIFTEIQNKNTELEVQIEDIEISRGKLPTGKELQVDTAIIKAQTEKEDLINIKKIEIIVFKIDEEEFALKVTNIKEIIRIPAITKTPGAPRYISGLCNLRDELLPVIDSRILFGMSHKEFDEASRIIVTDIRGKKLGLIADNVTEVISAYANAFKEPPSSIKGMDGGVISGILMLNNGKRVIMLLDAEKIVKAENLDDATDTQQVTDSNLKGSDIITEDEEQIVVFKIGIEEYGFNINYVKEIIRLPDIMRVPNTSSSVEGVFSIRNELLGIINLGKLLNMSYKEPDENSRVVILNNGRASFGVIVDKVSHVMQFQKKSLKESTHVANSHDTEYIKGIYNLNNGKRLVIMLEPQALINFEELKAALDFNKVQTVKDKLIDVVEADINFEQLVVFKLGDQEYGIEISNVKEINKMGQIINFPGAPVFIAGMTNLRGDIIPLLNLRSLFTDNDSGSINVTKFLAVEHENKRIGIMVDSTSEVLRLSKNYIEEIPEVFSGSNKFIEKVAKLNDGKRNILILNLKAILSFM